ncbi:MAG: HD domain-containing protein [Gemmatimonadota bacterium]
MGRRLEALHPIILAAADGDLPEWTVMSEVRRDHAERVARLMRKWAKARGLRRADRVRWSAAGFIHDALKGVAPAKLRKEYDIAGGWPDPVLHGPACAARLAAEGVKDRALLRAVAHHTTGHRKFDLLGSSLYLADYLDPGRRSGRGRRRVLRSRLPDEHDAVLAAVAAARIGTLLERRLQIPKVTVEFWSEVVGGR